MIILNISATRKDIHWITKGKKRILDMKSVTYLRFIQIRRIQSILIGRLSYRERIKVIQAVPGLNA